MAKKDRDTLTLDEQVEDVGLDEAKRSFQEDNQPPTIDTIDCPNGHPGNGWPGQAHASDPDGDPITYSLDAAPTGMTIDPSSGTMSWTPNWSQLGNHTVTVRATDSHGASDTRTCTVSITNAPPTCGGVFNQTGHPGQTVTFTATGSDPDGDTLTFSLVGAPTGASIDPNTGDFTWTPTWPQVGSHNVTVKVCDPGGACATCSCIITVANGAPQLSALSPITTHPGEPVTFTATASDPDSDPLVFSLVNPPVGATIDSSSGTFNWTPNWSQVGSYTIRVRVTDPGGLTDETTCLVNVANAAPQLSTLSPQTAHPTEAVTFTATATDPNGDTVTYSLTNPPSGATIDSVSGDFSWTPAWNQLGVHTICVRATDPGALFDEKMCQINVTNAAPQLAALSSQSTHPDETVTFSANASDSDGDTVTYSLVSAPSGASIDPSSGTFDWTPTPSQLGTFPVTVRASDPQPLTDDETCQITVTSPP